MKQLLSFVALGCTLAGASLALVKQDNSSYSGSLCSVQKLRDFLVSQPKGCPCPSKQSKGKNDVALMMFAYCCPTADPIEDRFSKILNAHRTQCGSYTFVDYGNESAQTVCSMIGLVPAQEKRFSPELQSCAKQCRYKHDRLCVTESSMQSEWDKYHSYPSCSDSSDSSESSDCGKKCPSSCEWRHKNECSVLCKPYKCSHCQHPTLLTFEDGEDQTCSLFVSKGEIGKNTVYRGFSIKNGGVYNPWLHRCEFADKCVYQSDIDAVVSKPQGLFSSQPYSPMSIYRKKPFGLISLFVTFSTKDLSRTADLRITAYLDKKEHCTETVTLQAGCPMMFQPKNQKAFSKVTKITFQYDLPYDQLDDAYLDIDNMFVCI